MSDILDFDKALEAAQGPGGFGDERERWEAELEAQARAAVLAERVRVLREVEHDLRSQGTFSGGLNQVKWMLRAAEQEAK